LELKDVYFVPSITQNIISISCLDLEGYHFIIKNKYYFLYRDDVCFCCGHLMNGLYVLENDKHILSVENDKKRCKTSHENSTFMGHCRLYHINEKHIKRLQDVSLLGQFNFESIDTCESYLLEKND
jgi:GAG-pre-integrase domain